MERASEDPELAQEVIRLLGNELKTVRRQLRELQAEKDRSLSWGKERDHSQLAEVDKENAELRLHLEDMRMQLEVALASQDVKLGPPSASAEEELRSQLAAVREDAESQTSIIQQLRDKLAASREKCKNYKNAMRSLQEPLDETDSLLEQATTENGQSLEAAVSHSPENISQNPAFDANAFLQDTAVGDFDVAADTISPFQTNLQLRLSKKARDIAAPHRFLSVNTEESIWPLSGETSRLLVFFPMHRYNAKHQKGEGGWQRPELQDELVRRDHYREVLCLRERVWCYMGTFECVDTITPSVEELCEIGSPQLLQYIHKQTVLFPDLVPPFLGKMVPQMYAAGALRVECFALRRVGFNNELNKMLHGKPKLAKYIAVPGEKPAKQAKRAADDTEEHQTPPTKKGKWTN